jgi:hypothetical protein
MINKSLSQKGSAHVAIIIVLVAALIGALGFVFWSNFIQPKIDTPVNDSTSLIKGKITEKRTSCGREVLGDDDKPKPVAGVCDGGNNIVINGVGISTGGGALTGNPSIYQTNIESVHAGDIVEVRYIQDKDGYPSTNCESCYIKKEGSSQKEPQDKLER